eukprot:CAMPEP_0204590724 /NCGR_PEP_ID=MMETSP0661-20131031/49946_1 /ASSEMBLY_ACC=CAM_ASM_000606 /TAXON_ID=109239 /ORGANISM="Alexandrium margalefi, Strain AMGDE01CS-322" /LENGTH=380 /DNA_ID=CAMNT_0051600779 /DNA_START=64 /DNA_END=1204 /DNA_ORIENTATION=-
MRSIWACAAGLAAVPLVASHANALADEVSLVQRVSSRDQPAVFEGEGFQLLCDPLHGCRYHLQTSSTPAPYQLICDDAAGCRYTGVTAPPPDAPGLFQGPDEKMVKSVLYGMYKAAHPKKPALNPMPLMAMAGAAAMAAMPKPGQAPQLPNISKYIPTFPLPDSKQVAKWMNEYKGADHGDLLKPTATGIKYLLEMLAPPKSGQAAPAAEPAHQPSTDEPVAHFVPDNKMCCVQGPSEYIRAKLAKLKASPLGRGYLSTTAVDGTCASQGYTTGPSPEKCFPKASLFLNLAEHPMDPTSEPRLLAEYGMAHGFAAIGKGMAELCKEEPRDGGRRGRSAAAGSPRPRAIAAACSPDASGVPPQRGDVAGSAVDRAPRLCSS